MKKILIFRHESEVGAPYFTKLLSDIGIPFDIIKIDKKDAVPQNIANDVAGLFFCGGTMSVNDSLPWIEDELNLIKLAYKRKFPIIGHCLGSQLISKALGGVVTKMTRREVGWYPISFLDNKKALEWQGNLPNNLKVLVWHGDEFSIPPNASSLFTTENCKNQAFVIDNILATIAHIEVSEVMLGNWLHAYSNEIKPNNSSVQTIKQIKHNLKNKIQEMYIVSDTFYFKWLKLVYTKDVNPNIYHKLQGYLKTGSCLCNQVSFFLKHPRDVVNCHCSECRKFHGNYAAFTKVKLEDIYIIGRENLNCYQPSKEQPQRWFCKMCGSSLFWQKESDNEICVAAGTLDVPTKLKTTTNIYTNYKSDYYQLDNNLKNHSGTMY